MANRKVFTASVIAQIASLVDQGVGAAEISAQVGCKLSSLRVRCSQLGVSLRRRKSIEIKGASSDLAQRLAVPLPQDTLHRLRHEAALMGISGSTLAATLLEVIVQDGLYEAVLDVG